MSEQPIDDLDQQLSDAKQFLEEDPGLVVGKFNIDIDCNVYKENLETPIGIVLDILSVTPGVPALVITLLNKVKTRIDKKCKV